MFNLFIMNDFKNSRFRSYIDTPGELEDIPLRDFRRAKLLNGELLIAETENVVLYTSLSEPRNRKKGVLTVTNFKLSFVPANEDDEYPEVQQNFFLKPYEICLSSIDAVYHINEKTRKKLNLGQSISHKIKELQVLCKNMQMFHFSFFETNKDKVKSIINAILYHAAPKRLSLLFAFDYRDRFSSSNQVLKDIKWFQKTNDWLKELDRTRTNKKWRVCKANELFQISHYLPRVFVVPASVEDHMLSRAAEHFQSQCSPVWVWGTRHNAALVRMADLDPSIQDRMQENIMLEHIRKSHDCLICPYILDLVKEFPSAKELQTSFVKLRELCNPTSSRLFKQQDNKFYSLLENTKWLQYVSMCLQKAVIAAYQLIEENCTVVLQEGNGRDMNCVISCLIQLILDSHWRTMRGFQSLIQKEWIVFGHPFTKRLGFINNDNLEPAPYFLLFLDCTWQLLQQYPTAFQFSETYLTTLWDTAHVTIFDTFLFDCEHEREKAKQDNKSASFLCAWDYSRQFDESDYRLFCNPLYDDDSCERLYPKSTVPFLDVWQQCYLRWLAGVEIINGGQPQVDLSCRLLAMEITDLRQVWTASGNEVDARPKYDDEAKENIRHLLQRVNSFYPFSRNDGQAQGLLPGNDLLSMDAQDSQSLLNLTNE